MTGVLNLYEFSENIQIIKQFFAVILRENNDKF